MKTEYTDTQRLDWLDAQRDPVTIDGETLLAYVWTIEAQNHTLRDAIDAAMGIEAENQK